MPKTIEAEKQEQTIPNEIPAEESLDIKLSPTVDNKTEETSASVLVEIVNFKFIPREVEIRVGQTVVWKNLDEFKGDIRPHMVVAHFGEFRSPKLLVNDTYYHTFENPGNFTYADAIFKMTPGKIVVKPLSEAMAASITGNIIGANKESAASLLIILLMVLLIIGLHSSKKIDLLIHDKNKER